MFPGGACEPVECIRLDGFVSAIPDPLTVLIQVEVPPGAVEGMRVEVEADDPWGSAPGGVKGKASVEAEDIEYGAAVGEQGDSGPVFPLIEKEAGFLSVEHIGFHGESLFEEGHDGVFQFSPKGLAVDEPGVGSGSADVPAQSEDECAGRVEFLDQDGDLFQVWDPGGGVEFHHQDIVVAIEDETWPAVAFPMDQAESGGEGVEEGGPSVEAFPEASAPPRGIDAFRLAPVEDADADGGIGVVESDGEETILAVVDYGKVAAGSRAAEFPDAFVIDPWMTVADVGFCRGAQAGFEGSDPGGGRGRLGIRHSPQYAVWVVANRWGSVRAGFRGRLGLVFRVGLLTVRLGS